MRGLTNDEAAAVERSAGEPMLAQVEAWAAVNSGSHNLPGLDRIAGLLADSFAALPGETVLREAAPVDSVTPSGQRLAVKHGRNLHLAVRPEAPVQLLFTGHMDTVFAADHAFQKTSWLEDGVLGGPGVADMKGG
ncbi:MAG: hypothetical protein ABIW83_01350, partial [Allosphingosinicella sp.]